MIWILVTFEILLLLEAKRRIRVLSVFDMIGVYIIACQIAFYLAQYVPIVDLYAAGQFGSYLSDNDGGLLLYFWVFLCCYAATLGLRVTKQVDMVAVGSQAISALDRWLGLILLGCVLAALVNFVSLDAGAIWYNNRYLLLSIPEGLAIRNGFTELVQSFSQIVGILAAFGFAVSLFTRKWPLALGFALVTGWYFSIGLAMSSRNAAILIFVIAVVASVLVRRGRLSVVGFLGLLCLLVLMIALAGRSTREYGIAMIPDHLVSAVADTGNRFLLILGNLTQGIFVTNDGFLLNPEHPELYKILSFSPFPSFIDGFESIRRVQEIRLHAFVPMSAITEAVAFGPLYTVIAAASLMLCVRLCVMASARSGVLFAMLMSAWVFLMFVQAGAYPMRNVYRQEVIAAVVLMIALYWPRRRSRPRHEALDFNIEGRRS